MKHDYFGVHDYYGFYSKIAFTILFGIAGVAGAFFIDFFTLKSAILTSEFETCQSRVFCQSNVKIH